MPRNRETADLCQRLQEQGFRVQKAKNGHWKVQNPETGQKCQIAATPRYSRGVLNMVTRLKRIGYRPDFVKGKDSPLQDRT